MTVTVTFLHGQQLAQQPVTAGSGAAKETTEEVELLLWEILVGHSRALNTHHAP